MLQGVVILYKSALVRASGLKFRSEGCGKESCCADGAGDLMNSPEPVNLPDLRKSYDEVWVETKQSPNSDIREAPFVPENSGLSVLRFFGGEIALMSRLVSKPAEKGRQAQR